MKKQFLIYYLLLLGYTAFAQEPWTILEKVNAQFEAAKTFSCALTYEYFEGFGGDSILDQITGKYSFKGNSYRMVLDSNILIGNDSIMINVDKNARVILVQHNAADFEFQSFPSIRQLKKLSNKIEPVQLGNETVVFRYQPEETKPNGAAFSDIKIDIGSYLPTEITTYYKDASVVRNGQYVRQDSRIVVQYSDQVFDATIADDEFNINRFIYNSPVGYTATTAYSGFDVIVLN